MTDDTDQIDPLDTIVTRDADGTYRGPLTSRAARSKAEDGTTLFVASTESEDRAMDVVRQDWRLGAFRANPVILDNHDRSRVVGVGVDAWVARAVSDEVDESMVGSLLIRAKWDLESPIVDLRDVGRQHLAGIRRAGSVGFRAGRATERHKLDKDSPYYREPVEIETWFGTLEHSGYLFERNELLEFSSATIPANPEAVQRAIVGPSLIERIERRTESPEDRAEIVREVVRAMLAGGPGWEADLAAIVEAVATHQRFLDALDARLRASGPIVRGLVEAAPVPQSAPSPSTTFARGLLARLESL